MRKTKGWDWTNEGVLLKILIIKLIHKFDTNVKLERSVICLDDRIHKQGVLY